MWWVYLIVTFVSVVIGFVICAVLTANSYDEKPIKNDKTKGEDNE